MVFVVDSSCIVAWLLGESEMADRVGFGLRLSSDSPLVPPL